MLNAAPALSKELGSAGGPPALGSDVLSAAFAPGVNPAFITVFPPAALRNGGADYLEPPDSDMRFNASGRYRVVRFPVLPAWLAADPTMHFHAHPGAQALLTCQTNRVIGDSNYFRSVAAAPETSESRLAAHSTETAVIADWTDNKCGWQNALQVVDRQLHRTDPISRHTDPVPGIQLLRCEVNQLLRRIQPIRIGYPVGSIGCFNRVHTRRPGHPVARRTLPRQS